MKKLIAILVYVLLFISCTTNDALKDHFKNPSDVQTSVYWYWISGYVSEEGVRKDLQAMKQAGINRAYIGCMDHNQKLPYKKVPFRGDEWWKITHTALKTATELGIEIGIFNSPGWSQSGGPWIKPEQAMRYLTSVTCQVEGGKKVSIDMKKPADDFQDVKVIAFPTVSVQKELHSGKVQFNKEKKVYTIDIVAPQDFKLRTLLFYPSEKPIKTTACLKVKEGADYRIIDEFLIDRYNSKLRVGFNPYPPVVISVPAVSAQSFRIEFDNTALNSELKDIVLTSNAYLERYPEKTMAKMYQEPLPYWKEYQWREQTALDDKSLAIDSQKVIDLSASLKGDKLEWNAPAGNWTVMRMGMRPTGVTNSPAEPSATGLEVDKMSKTHVQSHFEAYMGEIFRRIPEADRKSWKVVVQDSYETASQNFTDGFLELFKERYGYDPLPFLPVYQGMVVESKDRSDRFMWDVRRLVADRVAYDYVAGLRDVCHKYGLTTWLENYGHWGFPGEFLQYGGQSDEIGGEFWTLTDLGNIENRAASSCGHIYGKNKIYAESFTTGGRPFSCYPAMMKGRGDRFFSEGINSTLLTLTISQPSENRKPGLNTWYGSEFNRFNTWYPQLDLFTSYLKRTNLMLQQGLNVADVAYFIGEDAPKMTGITDPALPKGYQFDYINAEVIERDLTVKDGLLTLPHGTQYRILVLPKLKTMRPELLQKIDSLVNAGAVVLGPAPERSPSGENYGTADKQVKELAAAMWKGLDGKQTKSVRRGKGMLINGMNMEEALATINCVPDFNVPENVEVLYNHRQDGNKNIYFVTNQSDKDIELTPEFRVTGMQPELWDAVSGTSRNLDSYEMTETGTKVPLRLAPYESAFIVFQKKAGNGESLDVNRNCPIPERWMDLNNNWKVKFADALRGPKEEQSFKTLKDIATCKDDLIRYYSGTIVYKKDVQLDRIPSGDVYLNLREVGVMAKVKVNGQYAGGVWTAPYRLEVSNFLKPGNNQIEVEVVTTWQNRLIGDQYLPENERTTWVAFDRSRQGDELQKSGLVGPVSLDIVKK